LVADGKQRRPRITDRSACRRNTEELAAMSSAICKVREHAVGLHNHLFDGVVKIRERRLNHAHVIEERGETLDLNAEGAAGDDVLGEQLTSEGEIPRIPELLVVAANQCVLKRSLHVPSAHQKYEFVR